MVGPAAWLLGGGRSGLPPSDRTGPDSTEVDPEAGSETPRENVGPDRWSPIRGSGCQPGSGHQNSRFPTRPPLPLGGRPIPIPGSIDTSNARPAPGEVDCNRGSLPLADQPGTVSFRRLANRRDINRGVPGEITIGLVTDDRPREQSFAVGDGSSPAGVAWNGAGQRGRAMSAIRPTVASHRPGSTSRCR